MNTKSMFSAALISTALFAPALAVAAVSFGVSFSSGNGAGNCFGTVCSVASNIIGIINGVLVPLLFALAFIVFLYGIVLKYIFSQGDAEKVKEGHKLILWGLIAFVVMISLWGLVNVVANTFGLGGYSAPCPPSSDPLARPC